MRTYSSYGEQWSERASWSRGGLGRVDKPLVVGWRPMRAEAKHLPSLSLSLSLSHTFSAPLRENPRIHSLASLAVPLPSCPAPAYQTPHNLPLTLPHTLTSLSLSLSLSLDDAARCNFFRGSPSRSRSDLDLIRMSLLRRGRSSIHLKPNEPSMSMNVRSPWLIPAISIQPLLCRGALPNGVCRFSQLLSSELLAFLCTFGSRRYLLPSKLSLTPRCSLSLSLSLVLVSNNKLPRPHRQDRRPTRQYLKSSSVANMAVLLALYHSRSSIHRSKYAFAPLLSPRSHF